MRFLPLVAARVLPVVSTLALLTALPALSQVVIAPPLQIGSANPVTAEPLVSRPSTTPCTVPLFTNQKFADFNAQTFTYAPPSCAGPWAKVVFTADITVTAGRQYDHSAAFFLGGATLYRGTTPEPRAAFSPSWHVENDVTDLSALFHAKQAGEAHIDGEVDSTYTGVTYANAALQFYPVSAKDLAPAVPDAVFALPQGDPYTFYSTTSPLSVTLTLPTNVERAYLDLIAQTDEFWYTCVPNDAAAALQTCGGDAFRETDISIDGQPAGIAPARPYIYTGGIDPYLWAPITGLQTLDFKPYRVDLTPFAAQLSSGGKHTIQVTVVNTQSTYFATGNLLLYTDPGKKIVTGRVTTNTLSAQPSPQVTENLHLDGSNYGTATVTATAKRSFLVSGEVDTSRGKITTTVEQSVGFSNQQNFTISATNYVQDITQCTTVDTKTTTAKDAGQEVTEQHLSWPITVNIGIAYKADGSGVQTTTTDQADLATNLLTHPGAGIAGDLLTLGGEQVKSTDQLSFSPTFSITGHTGQKSSALDVQYSSRDGYYARSLSAKDGLLTNVITVP